MSSIKERRWQTPLAHCHEYDCRAPIRRLVTVFGYVRGMAEDRTVELELAREVWQARLSEAALDAVALEWAERTADNLVRQLQDRDLP